MVTYIVVRPPDLDRAIRGTRGGPDSPDTPSPYARAQTAQLAQRYANPDPLQQALLRTFHKRKETPKSSKAIRLARSRNSFRFGSAKKSAGSNRITGSSGKTVEVKSHSIVEQLECRQEEVLRALNFHGDAVLKNIPAYLAGLATILLENIIALSRDLDQMFAHSNSSEVASLMSRMNQSVAELIWWSDQYYLYGDDSHTTSSIQDIGDNIRQAVKSLVEFAINKENQNVPPSFFHSKQHNESSSSIGSSEESPKSQRDYGQNLSYNESAPPIPPKKKNKPLLKTNGFEPPLRQSSPINPHYEANCSHDPILGLRSSDSTNDSIEYPRRSTGSLTPCSTTHSFDRVSPDRFTNAPHDSVSPATSQDSMNQSLEDRSSFNSLSSIEQISENVGNLSMSQLTSPSLILGSMAKATESFSSQTFSQSIKTHSFTQERRILSAGVVKETQQLQHHSNVIASAQSHHLVVHRGSRASTCSSSTSSSRSSGGEVDSHTVSMPVPPPIPKKHRLPPSHRTPSHYDNVDLRVRRQEDVLNHSCEYPPKKTSMVSSLVDSSRCSSNTSETSGLGSSLSSVRSSSSRNSSGYVNSSCISSSRLTTSTTEECVQYRLKGMDEDSIDGGERPPLPIKKKNVFQVTDYMEIAKNYQRPNDLTAHFRHSQQLLPTRQVLSSSYLTEEINLHFDDNQDLNSRRSFPATNMSIPPALPPKRRFRTRGSSPSFSDDIHFADAPESIACPCACTCQEPISLTESIDSRKELRESLPEREKVNNFKDFDSPVHPSINVNSLSPARHRPLPNSTSNIKMSNEVSPPNQISPTTIRPSLSPPPPVSPELPVDTKEEEEEDEEEETLLDELEVSEHIILKDKSEDFDVKAGSPDALIVYATYSRNGSYLEAFLSTYRTFTTPEDLIEKLFYRYHHFVCHPTADCQKAAKNAFSLLVRVVHDLILPDLREHLLDKLAGFEYKLLAKGDLKLAYFFRTKLTEKLNARKVHNDLKEYPIHNISTKETQQHYLLDFKSHEIAEQMTLLDAELFNKVGIPEALNWSIKQDDELCPNLSVFTRHFNKMSYWVRTQILLSSDPEREKYFKKFIKVMKYLRKMDNFNSYLAILSALESTPVRRLDWQKTVTEGLKEYCTLIDSRGSFKAYRQALSEAKDSCIPYLGMILQDLHFIHVGNPDSTDDSKVDFLKRWHQFSSLEQIRRFQPCKYKFDKNENIINFFGDFDDHKSENELDDLSHAIKPKEKKKSMD